MVDPHSAISPSLDNPHLPYLGPKKSLEANPEHLHFLRMSTPPNQESKKSFPLNSSVTRCYVIVKTEFNSLHAEGHICGLYCKAIIDVAHAGGHICGPVYF